MFRLGDQKPASLLRRRHLLLGLAAAVAGLLFGTKLGWFTREPIYQGRTVSAWVSELSGVYYTRGRQVSALPVQTVTNEPAYRALIALGSNAVPVLKEIVMAPAEWPPEMGVRARMKQWVEWKSKQWRGLPNARPGPRMWSRTQVMRKTTAVVMLLAMGTNAQAGVRAYAEAYADAPKNLSVSGTLVNGTPLGLTTRDVIQVSRSLVPERELMEGIRECLHHSNPWCRVVALQATAAFPERLSSWSQPLLDLTLDENMVVREAALDRLLTIAQENRAPALIPDYRLELTAKAVLQDGNTVPRVKQLASKLLSVARGESHPLMKRYQVPPRPPLLQPSTAGP